MAERCCAPYKCAYCGCDVDRKTHRTACPVCIVRNDVEKEKQRFEAAEKLTEWDGPIYCESVGYNEGFFPSLGELYDYFECPESFDDPDEQKLPPYVYACNVIAFVHGDVGNFKGDLEGYEDWEGDTVGDDELQAALDAWAEKNKGIVRWEPDYKRAVLLSKSNTEAEQRP